MPEPDILFLLASFFSEIVGTMAGFGSSAILLPVALFFFDLRTALILVAIFHMSGNIGRIAFFRHGFDRSLLLRFGVPSILFTIIGALLVDSVPQSVLKLILGIFLVGYVTLSILRPSLYSQHKGIPCLAAVSLAVDISRIPVYLAGGYLPQEYYHFIPLLFLAAITGSSIGKRTVSLVPQEKFRTFVLFCIGAVSMKFTYDGLDHFFYKGDHYIVHITLSATAMIISNAMRAITIHSS
ncbi:sulfite exporter TauE/SafE family protein [Methanolobus chelungpuianus]|uniref:Probable membrane transporter protein n=1 Tax=Methanolobus chelungpuianus TaxID=502115 RepID=A0AAE3KWB2_9EURY|nr:sulfite exporter TauE/SafE family protein [Methanolobus chelungpuianus]MCQ6962032.1 sulfonate transporter [Methanolobus chelungpuianus]